METVKVESLDQKKFEPYGKVIQIKESQKRVDNTIVTHWHELADLSTLGAEPVIAFVECKQRAFVVEQLERHIGTSEIFFPLKGSAIMVFATSKPDGSPDLSTLRAFFMTAGHPFISNRGVWHWVPYPLGTSWESFLLVEKDLIESDLETYDLPGQIEIVL